MTIITNTVDAPNILNPEELRQYYAGTESMAACKMGTEIEYALIRAQTLSVPTSAQTQGLYADVQDQGYGARFEPPTSAIELATPPFVAHTDLTGLITHINAAHEALQNTAAKHDLLLSPFGHWPHIPLESIEIVNLERYQSFFVPPRADMIETFRFFTGCMNVQVSLGYQDPDHLLRIIRMATALEPFLFLTTDSSCNFHEGKPIAHIQNITQKQKMGVNTGIPDFYYSAKTGAELIDAHIDFTLNHPHIFAAFTAQGQLKRLPTGTWCAFTDLEAAGYGPQNMTNYLQAQSESWRRACNIATITDADGRLINHRAEIAACQTGLLHQRISATILGYLIGYDAQFYDDVQRLLHTHGIDLENLTDARPLLEANFNAACHHNNRYDALPFGTKTLGEFTREFANALEGAAQRHAIAAQDIAPLTHILRTGRPDWLVYREKLTNLEETLHYINTYKDQPNAFNAQSCADWLFGTK